MFELIDVRVHVCVLLLLLLEVWCVVVFGLFFLCLLCLRCCVAPYVSVRCAMCHVCCFVRMLELRCFLLWLNCCVVECVWVGCRCGYVVLLCFFLFFVCVHCCSFRASLMRVCVVFMS